MIADLCRSLAVLSEPPSSETSVVARALGLTRPPTREEFTDVFVMQLPPYASVYVGPDGMLGGEARDRVAGFWRALGLVPPSEADHVASLLGLYAGLIDDTDPDARPQREHSARALMAEHLLSWVPLYARRVYDVAPPPYREWSALLVETLGNAALPAQPDAPLPLHLRVAPGLPDPTCASLADILDAALIPVRSGIIVTRHDLACMARGLDIGLRQGERRFILGALVDQDPVGVFRWFAKEAARQRSHGTDPIDAFWHTRAEQTEHTFRTMASRAERTSQV